MFILSNKATYQKFMALAKVMLGIDLQFDGNKATPTICVITDNPDLMGEASIAFESIKNKAGEVKKHVKFTVEFLYFKDFIMPTNAHETAYRYYLDGGRNPDVLELEYASEIYIKGRGQIVVIPPEFLKNTEFIRRQLYTYMLTDFHFGRAYYLSSLMIKDMLNLCLYELAAKMDIRLTPFSERPTRVYTLKELPFKIRTGSDLKSAEKMFKGSQIMLTDHELGYIICRWLDVKVKYLGQGRKFFVNYVEAKKKKE